MPQIAADFSLILSLTGVPGKRESPQHLVDDCKLELDSGVTRAKQVESCRGARARCRLVPGLFHGGACRSRPVNQ
jgi:hypothetical protein